TFVSMLQASGHINDVIAGMAGSPEYYALHSSNNSMFVRGLYQDLLKRGSSDTEVLTWLNKLNTGESRTQVVAEFLATPEYQHFYVTSLFNLYLRRTPSTIELQQFEALIQGGSSDAALVQALVASNEYFLNPRS